MASNKAEIDRNEKREEILRVARCLFLDTGYELTSMSRIAAEAGVAPNTIYWYFADKDALLIGVLDALVADATLAFQKRKKGPLDSQLVWLLGEFDRVRHIIATVHARASVSEAVGTWHDNFHRMLETMLLTLLRNHGLKPDDLAPASRVTIFVIEGLLAHSSSVKDRRALVQWLVAAFQSRQSDTEHAVVGDRP